MTKKKQTKNPTKNSTPKEIVLNGITLKELPLDHPIYSEGIIIGGRITRDSLIKETKKKDKMN